MFPLKRMLAGDPDRSNYNFWLKCAIKVILRIPFLVATLITEKNMHKYGVLMFYSKYQRLFSPFGHL
jgi:hypothetical protein